MRSQDGVDDTSDVVPSLSNEEISNAQKRILISLGLWNYFTNIQGNHHLSYGWLNHLMLKYCALSEILSLLHDTKCVGHPAMSRTKLTVGTRF